MDMGGPVDVAATQVALNQLASRLGEAEFRESFIADPSGAAQGVGVDAGALPPGLLDALAVMSGDQLAIVSSVQSAIIDAVGELPDWAKVCIWF